MVVKSINSAEKKLLTSTEEIRADLVKRILRLVGNNEDQATDIPGLAIYRRDNPTGPIFGLYEPSLTLLVTCRRVNITSGVLTSKQVCRSIPWCSAKTGNWNSTVLPSPALCPP
ncbi:MAG TPA: hypothetical protein VK638_04990, partial [Edaphobacter sp.]|nr:hypothetical protein [Edaphobacter sp.]